MDENLKYLDVICTTVNSVAHLIIIFVFVRYKRLLSEKYNLLVLNFSVVDFLLIIWMQIGIRLMAFFYYNAPYMLLILPGVGLLLFVYELLIVTFLTVFWYMKSSNPDYAAKVSGKMKINLICIYTIGGICSVLLLVLYLSYYVATWSLVACIILVASINMLLILEKLINSKWSVKDWPFFLSNAYFMSKLPLCFLIILDYLHEDLGVSLLLFCLIIIAFSSGLYFLIILLVSNKDFKKCLNYSLGRRSYSVDDECAEQRNENNVSTNLMQER